jgi:uncharacterized membrane protein (UPF0127 family)
MNYWHVMELMRASMARDWHDMMKNLIKILCVVLCVGFMAACDDDIPPIGADLVIVTQDGKKHGFEVEIAITPQQMEKGLMNRKELPTDRGMLFWFGGDEDERGFWMKNTLIPLDMLFIKADGTILTIKTGQPLDETTIYSDGPVAAVFEINGGLSQKWGIKPGDTVHFTFFGNELAE